VGQPDTVQRHSDGQPGIRVRTVTGGLVAHLADRLSRFPGEKHLTSGQNPLPGRAVNVFAAPRSQPQLAVKAHHERERFTQLLCRPTSEPLGQNVRRRYRDYVGARPGTLRQMGRANIAVAKYGSPMPTLPPRAGILGRATAASG
jgi:hypothetical protein